MGLIIITPFVTRNNFQALKTTNMRLQIFRALINIISMIVSLIFVKLFKVETKQAIAVSVESGLKNSAIGLMIATTCIGVDAVELLILAYSFISFYLTLVVSLFLKRFVLIEDKKINS